MRFLSVITVICAALAAYLMFTNLQKVTQLRELQQDRFEVLNIKHGLLSLDEWKTQSYHVLKRKIEEFRLDGNDRATLKPQIEQVLYTVLNEVESTVRSHANQGGWFRRAVSSLLQDLVVDFNSIRRKIPDFTNTILAELGDETNQYKIKQMLVRKLGDVLDIYAARQDQAVRDTYFPRYDCSNFQECGAIITQRMEVIEAEIDYLKWSLFALFVIPFLLSFVLLSDAVGRDNLITGVLHCVVFLVGGLVFPMISIDARISDFNFNILGMQINFGEQMIFFQSKSILEVVQILFEDGTIDTQVVGGLILLFSIAFPVTKLFISLIVQRGEDNNSFINRFLTTKASKWSMADVFVVAIFMAFIGMRGVIGNQIASIESNNPFVNVVATDHTTLEIGFMIFLFFCLSSMALAALVKRFIEQSAKLELVD